MISDTVYVFNVCIQFFTEHTMATPLEDVGKQVSKIYSAVCFCLLLLASPLALSVFINFTTWHPVVSPDIPDFLKWFTTVHCIAQDQYEKSTLTSCNRTTKSINVNVTKNTLTNLFCLCATLFFCVHWYSFSPAINPSFT